MGQGRYGNGQSEGVLEVPAVTPQDIYPMGGRSSPFELLVDVAAKLAYGPPATTEQREALLLKAEHVRSEVPAVPDSLHSEGDWLWIPLRAEWRNVAAKPEEIVRQTFIRRLIDHYGYSLAQMDQERRTQHGHKSPRADIVIWETAEKKANNNTPVLIVECKSEGVDINVKDYYQGESYTRAVGCEFFIAHNTRFTAVFKLVPGLPGDFVQINEIARASD